MWASARSRLPPYHAAVEGHGSDTPGTDGERSTGGGGGAAPAGGGGGRRRGAGAGGGPAAAGGRWASRGGRGVDQPRRAAPEFGSSIRPDSSTASKSLPCNDFRAFNSSLFHRSSWAPPKNQDDPLSATIAPYR